MSNQLARTSLNFEFFKRINTDLTPFEVILYFFRNSNNMIVEDPNKGLAYMTWKNEIKEYIKLSDVETSWEKLIDGSYVRIKGKDVEHILPIRKELELIHFSFVFRMHNEDLEMIRNIKEPNFKIDKKYAESRKDVGRLKISVYLPIWPIWATVKRPLLGGTLTYTVEKVYMKVGDIFYRFPYGNVNSTDHMCFGGGNNSRFKNVDEMWINIITTPFNTDYEFNVRANRLNTPQYHRRGVSSSSRHEGRARPIINFPTFDLQEIPVRLAAKAYQHISFIDTLYYLSHIEEFDQIVPLDILYKLPNEPWEEKK